MPDSTEQLFLSARAVIGDGSAIRGGIPVIFPQFAAEGPLPRHGFARTTLWTTESTEQLPDGDASGTFVMRDSPATRAIWPHAFHARITVRVGGARLAVTLDVHNSGQEPFAFTAALHTYLRVHRHGDAELVGLHGGQYRESSAPDRMLFDAEEVVQGSGEIDRVYVDAPRHLLLREPGRVVEMELMGFPDVVVWNPGAVRAAALADMEPGGEQRMLCVEAAAVHTPVMLEPDRRWSGTQQFHARVLDT